MNPAGGGSPSGNADDEGNKKLPREVLDDLTDSVQKFHTDIQGKYKAPTYVHYGEQGLRGQTGRRGGLLGTGLGAKGDNRFAFGQVVWEGQGGGQVAPNATLLDDDENGQIELANGVKLRIAEADAPGDGTVPWQSGAAPDGQAGVERVFGHGQSHPGQHNAEFGYDHQEAYNDPRALYATLYAIVKIAQHAHWHKKESA